MPAQAQVLSIVVLALVTLQRMGELVLARRHTQRLLAEGGVEVGAEHYPLIVGLHAAWLVGLWCLAWDRPVLAPWLAAYLVLQGLRVWILGSLGRRWTTRIIMMPGEPLVKRGPYKFISHPNYVLVVCEIAVLPLTFGLWMFALVFSALNASVLWLRIRTENQALNQSQSS